MVAGATSFSQSSFGHTDYLASSGYQMALTNFTGLTVGAMLVNNPAGSGVGLMQNCNKLPRPQIYFISEVCLTKLRRK
jgi:hypothetical protein